MCNTTDTIFRDLLEENAATINCKSTAAAFLGSVDPTAKSADISPPSQALPRSAGELSHCSPQGSGLRNVTTDTPQSGRAIQWIDDSSYDRNMEASKPCVHSFQNGGHAQITSLLNSFANIDEPSTPVAAEHHPEAEEAPHMVSQKTCHEGTP